MAEIPENPFPPFPPVDTTPRPTKRPPGRPRVREPRVWLRNQCALARAEDPRALLGCETAWKFEPQGRPEDNVAFKVASDAVHARQVRKELVLRDPYGIHRRMTIRNSDDAELIRCIDNPPVSYSGVLGTVQEQFFALTGKQCRRHLLTNPDGSYPNHNINANRRYCHHLLCPSCWLAAVRKLLDYAVTVRGPHTRYWYVRHTETYKPGQMPEAIIKSFRKKAGAKLVGWILDLQEYEPFGGTFSYAMDHQLVGIWYSTKLLDPRRFSQSEDGRWCSQVLVRDTKAAGKPVVGSTTTWLATRFENAVDLFLDTIRFPAELYRLGLDAVDGAAMIHAQHGRRSTVSHQQDDGDDSEG